MSVTEVPLLEDVGVHQGVHGLQVLGVRDEAVLVPQAVQEDLPGDLRTTVAGDLGLQLGLGGIEGGRRGVLESLMICQP